MQGLKRTMSDKVRMKELDIDIKNKAKEHT